MPPTPLPLYQPPPPPPTPPPSPTTQHHHRRRRQHQTPSSSHSESPPLSASPSPPASFIALPTISIHAAAAKATTITTTTTSRKTSATSAPTTPPPSLKATTKYSFKTKKSSSLDNEIFLNNRKCTEWKQQRDHQQLQQQHSSITRAASTSSLASSFTASNYQEYKMEIINQGKCLCGQYIRARLRRAGVLNRKAIQRLRNILEPSTAVVYQVFPALNSMGEELERMHPRVYTNVSRQLSRAPFGELEDSDSAPMLLNLVAKDLFRSSITWGKIISIFAVCGGFAIDCVRQGHYDYLQCLVDGIAQIIEDDLVHWLAENGGWLGLQQHIRPPVGQITLLGWLALFVTVSSGVYVVANCVKHVGCHLYSLLF